MFAVTGFESQTQVMRVGRSTRPTVSLSPSTTPALTPAASVPINLVDIPNGACSVCPLDGPNRDVRPRDKWSRVADGLSNTALIAERHIARDGLEKCCGATPSTWDGYPYWNCGNGPGGFGTAWVAGVIANGVARSAYEPGPSSIGSWHPGVCHFVMADGSVKAVGVSITQPTLTQLAQVNDGVVSVLP